MCTNIWIPNDAYKEITDEAARFYPKETGGILLGYKTINSSNIVITNIIGPGPNSFHSYFRFTPDHQYQQKLINEYFYKSNGVTNYLGDWHTHPNGICKMSFLDKLTLGRIAKTPSANSPNAIMAIIAGSPDEWDIKVFRMNKVGLFVFNYDIETIEPYFFDPLLQ